MDYTTEKKLRPLYEALDEGQNKIALQHCTKLLKKSPDWPLVKALKALVFVRTGKDEEAFDLCEQVKKAIPTDEPTLQAVTMALKELGKHSLIVELYENAANSQPKNEEFSIQWFMAMVRNNDFKGQQAAAVKLHRVFKQNKYLFWAIMSLALQGASNPLSYVLAERMMAKALDEKRLEQVEHMRLYLLILMDQKKNEQALELLLNTDLGQKSLRDPEVRQIKSELLRVNQRWEEALAMSKEALETENSDDWFHWLAYFESAHALTESNPNIMDQVKKLVQFTQKQVLENKILKRGPFLAELDLDHRLFKIQKRDEKEVLDHIVSYFSRFGSKSCVFEDIQTYVSFLRPDTEKSRSFIDQLKQTIKPANDKPAKVKNVYTLVNVRKLERFLGLHSDSKTAVATVNELWKEYQDALPLGDGLEKTEMQYGDDFCILAGHLLLDQYLESKNSSFLIQAVSLLEVALLKSIHNFQIKLLLVRLYTLLGVYKRPFEIYRTMEIKQIQFDTMIHYFTDRFSSLGCADELENILYDALSIYKSNEVETPEMLVKAYQYGTFSKIQEFIEFRRRLDTSIQHSINDLELLHLDFIHASFQIKYAVQFFQDQDVSQLKFNDEFIQARSDNRDFKVMTNYNAENKLTAEQLYKPTATSSNSTWVQIMSFIFNILSIVCETKDSGRDVSAPITGLKTLLTKEHVKSDITESEFWLASYVSELSSAYISIKTPQEATEHLKSASLLLKDQVDKIDAFTEQRLAWSTFHKVSIALDAFNYGSILIEMMNRSLGLNSKDAKRKATEKTGSDPFMASFIGVQDDIKKFLQHIQTVAKGGKELFRQQLQKKIFKEVVDSETTPEYFKLKDSQSLLNHHIKEMISSWSLSATQLSDEIDRRIQKL